MRKHRILAFLFLYIVATTSLFAQKERNSYINFSYGIEHLENKNGDFLNLKSDYTVGLTMGHSYSLHRTPLFSMLTFCIDWTYLDVKFSDYSTEFQEKYAVGEAHLFNVDASMHVGPSIRLRPISKLSINAYFHYAPTFTDYFNGEFNQYDYKYSSQFVIGFNVAYSVISVGFDYRTSTTDHTFKVKDDYAFETEIEGSMHKSAPMVYLSFRF